MPEDDGTLLRLPPPQMPAALAQQVTVLAKPVPAEYAELPPLGPCFHPDAAEWLRRKREALARAASRQDCQEWFWLVAGGVNGVTETGFKSREFSVWEQCEDLPAAVWCSATRKAVWDRTPHLPSPGEVRDVLVAYKASLERELSALQRIAGAPDPSRV